MQDRSTAMEKYAVAKRQGRVDEDIIPLLDAINSSQRYYTTSSCSGRIGIMEIPDLGEKISAQFLGKWHRAVKEEEIRDAISKYRAGYLYLLVQSAILHVVCEDVESAKNLIRVARECGFKYSTIKSMQKEGVLLEILSTEHLQIPLGSEGRLKICDDDIPFFVEMANKTLERVKFKLNMLEKKISFLLHGASLSSSTG